MNQEWFLDSLLLSLLSSGSRMSKELHYYNEKDIEYLILL